MRASPIQILESKLLKIHFEQNKNHNLEESQEISIQSAKGFQKHPAYWSDQDIPPSVKDRTFLIRLAIRTNPNEEFSAPYTFEIIFSGTILIEQDKGPENETYALQYGLSILYGSIRELVLNISSRMTRGPFMLPTMSFMDENIEHFQKDQKTVPAKEKNKRTQNNQKNTR